MKKEKIKVVTALIGILILLSIFNKVDAISDYTITNYDIDMTVNEDNTFDITEKINVYFNFPKHGIYRKIPLKNSVKRLDGSISYNNAIVNKIKVNEKYSVSQKNGYKNIKIGNADKLLTGAHTYIIKYRYNIGDDPLKNTDELYYNIIGTEWDTNIEKVNFKISMPKEFDNSSLGFSSGYYSTVDSSNVSFSVNGNEISGFTKNELLAGQALTIRLTLPEGYFVKQKGNLIFLIGIILLGCICIGISYYFLHKYIKDRKLITTVEFYAPEGYNSAEIQFLYDGELKNRGVMSLLIYLANNGYIKIVENTKENENKEILIYRLRKNYYGENKIEEKFFYELFKNKDCITLSSAKKDFYLAVNEIKKQVNSKANKEKIFDKKMKKMAIIPSIQAIIIFVLVTVESFIKIGKNELLPLALIYGVIGIVVLQIILLNKNMKLSGKIIAISGSVCFFGFPWIFLLLELFNNITYFITFEIGILFTVILTIFIALIPDRTKYGMEILGKIKGFKRFLETAEKAKLEALVMENPSYFFSILPYTYALDISEKWIKQFETLVIKQPDWYYSSSEFAIDEFGKNMDKIMNRITTIDTTRTVAFSSSSSFGSSSGDSSGGSSGGGFSGGGSGGGGGGSW